MIQCRRSAAINALAQQWHSTAFVRQTRNILLYKIRTVHVCVCDGYHRGNTAVSYLARAAALSIMSEEKNRKKKGRYLAHFPMYFASFGPKKNSFWVSHIARSGNHTALNSTIL
jgi:hypothetical protein